LKVAILTDQIDADFEKAVFLAKKWGFQYLEIHALWGKTVECLSDYEVNQMARILNRYHLRVSCLSTTLFLMCPLYHDLSSVEKFSDHFLTYTDTYAHHLERLEWCFEMGKRVGAACLRIFPFRLEKGEITGRSVKTVVSDIAEKLAGPVQRAEHHRLPLVIENCPFSYLPRGIMTFHLLCVVGNPYLKLLWDVGNSFHSMGYQWVREYSDASLVEEYQMIRSHILNIHVKDLKRGQGNEYRPAVLGSGDIPYREIFALLKGDCYAHFVTGEPELYDYEGISQSVQALKNLTRNLEGKE